MSRVDLVAPAAGEVAEAAARLGMAPPPAEPEADPELPRLRRLDDGLDVVLVGVAPDGALHEVRCHLRGDALLTVRPAAGPPLDEPPAAPAGAARDLADVVEAVLTTLVGRAGELSDRVERLADRRERGDIARIRAAVTPLRRVTLLQQDVIGRLASEDVVAADASARRRVRDSYGRAAQVVTELEAIREALHDIAADRQNELVGRLTVVAVVFLPLTFLTGFFGQNFPWLVDHIGGPWWFASLGLVLPVAAVAALLALLRRGGWV
ncbi:CorA family divalent cation transporter [Miltoncostaea marina]|uniref:CorA family divalent cation transporter n=1 Tax=Miltoncostaea marina TaxID=2843215 RepID=UPI001C3C596D|nr:CorA family divalent cation transporter [Miltoncostaea marina]